MLCILRLSLTSKWFGFTFLWSPAGRCLRGALPIAGTLPPSPPLSLHLPPSLPSSQAATPPPSAPSPPLLTYTHIHRGWLAGFHGLPAPAARPRLREPPARPPGTGASGPASSASRSLRKSGQVPGIASCARSARVPEPQRHRPSRGP